MAGRKQRYSIRFEDGTVRTVEAQGYQSAKRVFTVRYSPPRGTKIVVWPQDNPGAKRNMRI